MSSSFPPGGSNQFGDVNPYQSPTPQPGWGNAGAGGGREQALARVKVPAIMLMILAPLGILLFAVDGGFRLLNIINDNVPMNGLDMNAPGVKTGFYIGQYGTLVVEVLGFFLQIVVLVGAYHMMTLKNRTMAMAANIISCVPCISACCVLGMPFGIWGQVLINDPAIKPFFES